MSKVIEAIFSKSTRAIIVSVFTRPDGIHLRALIKLTGLGSASAQRELSKLTEAGLLVREEVGKVVLYKPNTASPIYAELNAIVRKTDGVVPILKETLEPFGHRIERAFIYGSVAKQLDTATSDVDLFVLADDIGSADLYPILTEIEKKLERKISLTVYRPAEYRRKLAANNHFLVSVMSGPKIDLIGNQDA